MRFYEKANIETKRKNRKKMTKKKKLKLNRFRNLREDSENWSATVRKVRFPKLGGSHV